MKKELGLNFRFVNLSSQGDTAERHEIYKCFVVNLRVQVNNTDTYILFGQILVKLLA